MADSLSQDEIDALLSGADNVEAAPAAPAGKAAGKGASLSAKDTAAAKKTLTLLAQGMGDSLYASSMKQSTLEVQSAAVQPFRDVASEFSGETLLVRTSYSAPAAGQVFTLVSGDVAKSLAGLTMGMSPETLDDEAVHSLQDVFAQMFTGGDSKAESDGGVELKSSSPKLSAVDAGKIGVPEGDYFTVRISMTVEDLAPAEFLMLWPLPLARAIGSSGSATGGNSAAGGDGLSGLLGGMDMGGSNVQTAEFGNLVQTADPAITGNINLLLDVPMEVTVELGRAVKTVQEVLSFGEGSIIELDKLAGEPVNLLVNGKVIAKGEVVVIDENFGVRVTEIVNLKQRNSNPEE